MPNKIVVTALTKEQYDKFQNHIDKLGCKAATFIRTAILAAMNGEIDADDAVVKLKREKKPRHFMTQSISEEMGIEFDDESDPNNYYILNEEEERIWRQKRAKYKRYLNG